MTARPANAGTVFRVAATDVTSASAARPQAMALARKRMPSTLPASSGARKWPGHHSPNPPSRTAQALRRRPGGRIRVRETAKISEASHRSVALIARATTQGSSRWLSREFMKRGARLVRKVASDPPAGAPTRSFRYHARYLEHLRPRFRGQAQRQTIGLPSGRRRLWPCAVENARFAAPSADRQRAGRSSGARRALAGDDHGRHGDRRHRCGGSGLPGGRPLLRFGGDAEGGRGEDGEEGGASGEAADHGVLLAVLRDSSERTLGTPSPRRKRIATKAGPRTTNRTRPR